MSRQVVVVEMTNVRDIERDFNSWGPLPVVAVRPEGFHWEVHFEIGPDGSLLLYRLGELREAIARREWEWVRLEVRE
jgi:hypothetical protein